MKIDDVGFNKEWAAKLSEAQFLKEMEGEGYAHIFEGKDRLNRLKDAYKLLKAKPKDEEVVENNSK